MASESESEKRETSADVADEIRRAVESMGDEIPYTVSAGTMRRVADRIEAAWKRQEKTYLDQIRDAMNMWGHEKHIAEHAQKPTVGNAAAMREALVSVRALIDDEPEGTPMIDEMKTTIESALSAPARQCDVGTAEEQGKRFNDFCSTHVCSKCVVHDEMARSFNDGILERAFSCRLVFSQMPYEAKEGGAS